MLWLSGCGMAGSDDRAPCPPIVDYTMADQARAADEVEALPEGAVIVRMLGDYAVLRDQAQICLSQQAPMGVTTTQLVIKEVYP